MDGKVLKLSLAGLLHDIGKIRDRTGLKHNYSNREGLWCPVYNGNYSHKHVLHTVSFFDDLKEKNPRLVNKFFSDEFINMCAKHHAPDSNNEEQELVKMADHLSAGADRIGKNSEFKISEYKKLRMEPLFVKKNDSESQIFEYPLCELYGSQVEGLNYPIIVNPLHKAKKTAEDEYRDIYLKMLNAFSKLSDNLTLEEIYNQSYGILENYATYIPSATNDIKLSISLFDHLKTTAAIAACIAINKKQEFILFEGDLSGIQKFIFQVAEGEEAKQNVAKNLRGRSLYIKLLTDFIAYYIVRKMELPISNVLYCGGGNFMLLIPNSIEYKDKMKEITSQIDMVLFDRHNLELSLASSYIEMTGEQLAENYAESIGKLKEKTNCAKYQRFSKAVDMKEMDLFQVGKHNPKLCKICNIEVDTKYDICLGCQELEHLGTLITDESNSYVTFLIGEDRMTEKPSQSDLIIELGKLGQIQLSKIYNDTVRQKGICYNLNNYTEGENYLVMPYARLMPRNLEDKIIAFDELIKNASIGTHKLGMLKMDVDNLGAIFSMDQNQKVSMSRTTTMSRFLGLFFSVEIENICRNISDEIIEEYGIKNVSQIFYINFAGGDDLFIIGPWFAILKLAKEIKTSFSEYVCSNPDITISAGVNLVSQGEPIRSGVHGAEEYLEEAKSFEKEVKGKLSYKDAITFLKEPFRWVPLGNESQIYNDLIEPKNSGDYSEGYNLTSILDLSDIYLKWIEEKKISRTMIYKWMTMIDEYLRNQEMQLIPRFMYSISRNISSRNALESYRHFKGAISLTNPIKRNELLSIIRMSIKITLYRLREV